MVVLNEMSRFHLAIDALTHVPRLRAQSEAAIDLFNKKLYEHQAYIREHLEDMPEIRNWQWSADFQERRTPPPQAKGHPRAALFTDS
jgi:xylulose-5-phosphate/fructose-6-phosphate phosphoketolase